MRFKKRQGRRATYSDTENAAEYVRIIRFNSGGRMLFALIRQSSAGRTNFHLKNRDLAQNKPG
jgi:hypothetical protein